jgi:hypothetical protein
MLAPKTVFVSSRRVKGGSQRIASVCRRSVEGITQNEVNVLGKYPGWQPKNGFCVQAKCRRWHLKNSVCVLVKCPGIQPKNIVIMQASSRWWHTKNGISVLENGQGWQLKLAPLFSEFSRVASKNVVSVLAKCTGWQPNIGVLMQAMC